jgi:hypothetical protein
MIWAGDFSYAYYLRILDVLCSGFELRTLGDADKPASDGHTACILRHDVDVSLARAVSMARLEHSRGVRATYMLMVDSPLYNLGEPRQRALVKDLIACGHEIGLHWDPRRPSMANGEMPIEDTIIEHDCLRLEKKVDAPVRSVSFHRPPPTFLGGRTKIAGRINAYAKPYMKWYLSDSAARWRQGEPLPSLRAPQAQLLQLLVHPVWWDEQHKSGRERIAELFAEMGAGQNRETTEMINAGLAYAVPSVWHADR